MGKIMQRTESDNYVHLEKEFKQPWKSRSNMFSYLEIFEGCVQSN